MKKGTNTLSSFTVEDDLLSESSFGTYSRVTNNLQKYYKNFDQMPAIGMRKLQQIRQKAKQDVFKQQSNKYFNPFDHKLKGEFLPNQQQLYLREKQKFQQQLKKQQQQKINSTKSYTIIFNDGNKPTVGNSNIFQMCANKVLNNNRHKSIKRPIQSIQQNDSDYQEDHINKSQDNYKPKSNNYIAPIKSSNNVGYTPNTNPKKQPKYQPKLKSQKPPIPKTQTKKLKIQQSKNPKKYSDQYQGSDRGLVEQLEREIVQVPTIGFQDIAQLETAKNLLQEAVLLPKLMPEFFQGIRRATKGILLFGPPGTGKTLLAKAIAKGNVFFNVSASSLASKWKGQSQKLVRILFEMAKFHSPSVIFFDEIDSIGSRRSEQQSESNRKVKSQLLVQMDGVSNGKDKQIFVLAATNRPWDLDEALRRRLQKRIYIPLPTAQGRKKMFEINLKSLKVDQKINWQKIVKLTKDYSGADIAIVCREAAYMPMRKKLAQIGGVGKIKQIKQLQKQFDVPLTEGDFIEAVKNVNKSVGNTDLKKYEEWMKEFGSS